MAFTPYVKIEITGKRIFMGLVLPSTLWKSSDSDVVQYSYDGVTWKDYNYSSSGTATAISILQPQNMSEGTTDSTAYNNTLYLRGKLASMHAISSSSDHWSLITMIGSFTSTVGGLSISGSISALFDYTTESPAINIPSACDSMFIDNVCIGSAQNLELNISLNSNNAYCYTSMFKGCIGLQAPPILPATALNNFCYSEMFKGCTSLLIPPSLPATTLTSDCYQYMFEDCTNLLVAPSLPATTLAVGCYQYMFKGCTSLLIPPSLPATTLAISCYKEMFSGCTSLLIAPNLPATTLKSGCYSGMFSGCTSLTIAPKIAASTVSDSEAFYHMFGNCTSLNVSTSGPAPHMLYLTSISGQNPVAGMFNGTAGSTADPIANTKYYCSSPVSIGASSYTTLISAVAKFLASRIYTSTTIGLDIKSGATSSYNYIPFSIRTKSPAKNIIWNLAGDKYNPDNTSIVDESTILTELTTYLNSINLGASQFARGTVVSSKYFIYLAQAIADFIIKKFVVCYSASCQNTRTHNTETDTYEDTLDFLTSNGSGSLRKNTTPDTQQSFNATLLHYDSTPTYNTPTHVNKTADNITEEDIENILQSLITSFSKQSVTSPMMAKKSVTSSSSSSSSSCSSSSSTSSSCSCSSIFIAYFNI